ncbi:MAG TPA: indole-3-glycerol phosphate synthase TrpC [Pyrinomonadaceae bacterium]|nr:indole-3-glycerol phosphate synthase TrpC [Pyrinomonadaceae bacterium]
MSNTFLEKVTAEARQRVAAARTNGYLPKLKTAAEQRASDRSPNVFRNAISRSDSVNIIAEIKRSSPSRGVIKAEVDVIQTAKLYAAGGAAAISVLTEPKHFDGSISDLVSVTRSVDVPILRKDFIVDEYQIVEAAAAGASAILLIVAALSVSELASFYAIASDLGLDAIVEVHDATEMHKAIDLGANIIGVNNRDLKTLEVSLDTSRKLIDLRPDNAVMIAESGISTRDEINELRGLGYDGFLIGETLMRSGNIIETLRGLTQ